MKTLLCSVFVILFALSSGSFSLCALRLRFEQALRLCCTGMMAFLFVFGLLDCLRWGLWLLAFMLPCLVAVTIIRQRACLRAVASRFFSPGFFLFLLLCLGFLYLDYNRRVYIYDELSHWADTVKAMVQTNRFAVYPDADAFFPSYPPALSLLQYFFVSLHLAAFPAEGFREELLYLSYQLFLLSFLMPFLRTDRMSPLLAVLSVVGVLAAPLLFSAIYTWLYVDGFLSVLLGCGLAAVFFPPFQERHWQRAYLLCVVFTLTLAKAVGFVLALFLAVTVALHAKGKDRRFFTMMLGASVLPKLLWSMKVRQGGARPLFPRPVDLSVLWRVTLHREPSFRQEVYDGFWRKLSAWSFNCHGRQVSALMLALLAFGALALMGSILKKRGRLSAAEMRLLLLSPAVQMLLYLVGLRYLYCISFSETEALLYSSIGRYAGITLCAVWLLMALQAGVLCRSLGESVRLPRTVGAAVLVMVLLLGNNFQIALSYMHRDEAHQSQAARVRTDAIEKYFAQHPEEKNGKIFVVSQEERGADLLLLHYIARPHPTSRVWHLTAKEETSEGSVAMTPEAWRDLLLDEYEYVAVFVMEDWLEEHFSEVVDEPLVQGQHGVLWRVNRETGLLTRLTEI